MKIKRYFERCNKILNLGQLWWEWQHIALPIQGPTEYQQEPKPATYFTPLLTPSEDFISKLCLRHGESGGQEKGKVGIRGEGYDQ